MNIDVHNHYYGDVVRILFVISGLIMVITYPFFKSFIDAPLSFSIAGCIALAIFGGLMNPKQRWIMVVNVIITIIAFVVFEYAAVYTYLNLSPTVNMHVVFFWVNQTLSVIFFLAAYLSVKTLRGSLVV